MQFVKNGPSIPERLLQSHENGEVVFFCGAGISYPAGLPTFSGLVTKVRSSLGVQETPTLARAIKENRFDTALSLIEQNEVEGRRRLREAVVHILKPDYTKPNARRTHESLLELARTRKGKLRLVTTNFDRIFEDVMRDQPSIQWRSHCAPFLQIPKGRWNGLLYLHGLISAFPTEDDLNHLVLTSGDFGLAYLIERWASRFVSELFKRYTVCFVGYSVNDPVLRYMTDAIAADKQMGESAPEMFALASYTNKRNETQVKQEWEAKQITPILYKDTNQHGLFHETLYEWSKTYRDGVYGKCHVIARCSDLKPTASTAEDNFVGRVLWALEDPTGQPAKIFAETTPPYGLEWLEELSKKRYNHDDLNRFGIMPDAQQAGRNWEFSLAHRPSPYHLSTWMGIVSNSEAHGQIDDILRHLTEWLMRHLGAPSLIHWVAKREGGLHEHFSRVLSQRLQQLMEWEITNDPLLEQLKSKSPQAIPSKAMRTLWRCALLGLLDPPAGRFALNEWIAHVTRDGIKPTLITNLRRLLEPRITLRSPYRMGRGEKNDPQSVREIAEADVDLACGSVRNLVEWKGNLNPWQEALPLLLPVFQEALRTLMDTRAELEQITEEEDFSFIHRPSIQTHEQHDGRRDWMGLIDLTMQAMNRIAQQDTGETSRVAESWMMWKYPLFVRMAFYAAAQGWVKPERSLAWLISDHRKWLYSPRTKYESIQLLVYLYPLLKGVDLEALELALLAGPHQTDDLGTRPETASSIRNRILRDRLIPLHRRSISLSPRITDLLEKLNMGLGETSDEKIDEFPFQITAGRFGREAVAIPRAKDSWLERIKTTPSSEHQDDNWSVVCREDRALSLSVLQILAGEQNWPVSRWIDWLRASMDAPTDESLWDIAIPLMSRFPQIVARQCAWWTKEAADRRLISSTHLIAIITGWLPSCEETILPEKDPIHQAINNSAGHLTQAMIAVWQTEELRDDGGLPTEIAAYITQITSLRSPSFRCGLLILALHLTTLYRVDKSWTRTHLLPHLSWKTDKEIARIAWSGFLWSPRLYPPLLAEIKIPFMECARKCIALGADAANQYYSLLVVVGTEPRDIFVESEIKAMLSAIPQDGVDVVAETLNRFTEGAGEQVKEYWEHRAMPFFEKYFPKRQDAASERVGHAFAEIIVCNKDTFAGAYDLLHGWVKPYAWPDQEIEKLIDHGSCSQFPVQALGYLAAYMPTQLWAKKLLQTALRQIRGAKPELAREESFRKLSILCELPPES